MIRYYFKDYHDFTHGEVVAVLKLDTEEKYDQYGEDYLAEAIGIEYDGPLVKFDFYKEFISHDELDDLFAITEEEYKEVEKAASQANVTARALHRKLTSI